MRGSLGVTAHRAPRHATDLWTTLTGEAPVDGFGRSTDQAQPRTLGRTARIPGRIRMPSSPVTFVVTSGGRPLGPARSLTVGLGRAGHQAPGTTVLGGGTEARPPHGPREGACFGYGRRHHEAAARERRPLRAPDPSLEPEDEAVHLHRPQRHLHHRPAAVADLHRPRLRVHQGDGRPRRLGPVRRHQEAGPGGDRRAGDAGRHAVREPALARRHAHQLPDRPQAAAAPEGARERSTSTTCPARA